MAHKKEKYLFLYLNTGGGHLAPARAIADYFESNYKDEIEATVMNPIGETNKFLRMVIEEGYRVLQNKATWLYEVIYACYKVKPISALSSYYVAKRIEKHFLNTIRACKPDKIIILHFFCIEPVYRVLAKYKFTIPVLTLVTDPYTAHPVWFLRKGQRYIVFSETLAEKCIERGIPEENLKVLPFVINKKFSVRPSPEAVQQFREKFGFREKKVVLVLGGRDGIPHGLRIVKNLLAMEQQFEIAIVCGKNKELFDGVTELKGQADSERLKVFGYVDFVYELISSSDIVITKCGASTFMEILMLGKIPVVNSYLWEQEKGNVEFLVDNNLGLYEKNVEALPELIDKLLTDESYYNTLRTNIEAYKPVSGTKAVAEYIKSVR